MLNLACFEVAEACQSGHADAKLPPGMLWPKPVIFISAVSKELRSARDVVAKTLLSLGYEPEWQDIFGAEQGDIKEMLRRRIDAADGVIQIIGQCHGFEPPQPNPDFGRVSYTQYEARYARQRGKRSGISCSTTPSPPIPTTRSRKNCASFKPPTASASSATPIFTTPRQTTQSLRTVSTA